jgi:prepilin-type N-terminal cleavage/methylation domain-containing protein
MKNLKLQISNHARIDDKASGHSACAAFTLIELSIVLVIIGLIVGGVLVGQELIRAATVRAQVTQIEKYQTAANTFRGKYNALPGDIAEPDATNFGFLARGAARGQGDGNSSIEANVGAIGGQTGEAATFWVDLFTAKLISDGLNKASPYLFVAYSGGGVTQEPYINYILPEARIGDQNYVYVYSTSAVSANSPGPGGNWFGISRVGVLTANTMWPNVGISPAVAYALDKKIDDGFPQAGNVVALYPKNVTTNHVTWAGDSSGVSGEGASTYFPLFQPTTAAQAGSSTTCYDNSSAAGKSMQYSTSQSGGLNKTCALSIKMQ